MVRTEIAKIENAKKCLQTAARILGKVGMRAQGMDSEAKEILLNAVTRAVQAKNLIENAVERQMEAEAWEKMTKGLETEREALRKVLKKLDEATLATMEAAKLERIDVLMGEKCVIRNIQEDLAYWRDKIDETGIGEEEPDENRNDQND